MTATPKSVIMAVVLFLGVFALAGLVGTVFLIDGGKATGAEIALVNSPTVFVLGVLGGLLGSTRTTPELPPGAVLQTGETTMTTPPAVASPADVPATAPPQAFLDAASAPVEILGR